MPCFRPLKGFRSRTLTANGKRGIVFNRSLGFVDLPVTVPCGQCSACRLEHSRQWAIRCVHEAQLHPENSFITLTYNDDYLPEDRSLDYRHFQLFMKRFTKMVRKTTGHSARFYMCGEYGDQLGRPHYHACIFGYDFPDKKLWKHERDVKLYRSEALEELWPYGYSTVGDVTFQSAAYVARYIMKKITGDPARAHYEYINPDTGEITQREPEFTRMSLKPGIAAGWLEKFKTDVYPSDFVVLNGRKMRPPKFYDRSLEVVDPNAFSKIKKTRREAGKKVEMDNTPERLKTKERVLLSRISQLKRTLQ